jgi:hypothetical protein
VTRRARNDPHACLGLGLGDPKELIRKPLAEPLAQLAQPGDRKGTIIEPARVDPCLHGDMRLCFELEVAFLRIAAVVALERALDVDRMGVVPLDQVTVVAVHRPNQIGQGADNTGR